MAHNSLQCWYRNLRYYQLTSRYNEENFTRFTIYIAFFVH